nr:transposase [Aureliella helgolandensis]
MRLSELADGWGTQAANQFDQSCTEASCEKQRVFGEFQYTAGTWDRERRVIVRAEYLPAGPNTRFIVTNFPGEPQELYDQLYVIRGDMENRIKEQQLMLFADCTSCHDFQANQFRLLLSTFAYVLVEALRRDQLSGTELAKAQADTIRVRLLKLAARVRTSVRGFVFHFASRFPRQEIFRTLATNLLLDTG